MFQTSLTALRAFEAAARHGSFTLAARQLSVTRPAISKQLRLLEEDLGHPLFIRRGDGVELTPEGAELYESVAQAFSLMQLTIERIRTSEADPRRIRILVEQDFAASWLASRVGNFLLGNSGTSVEIVAERNGVFRAAEDFSFRIFYGTDIAVAGRGLEGTELCRWVDLPLCTSGYAGLLGKVPFDGLRAARLLHDRTVDPWKNWLRAAGFKGRVEDFDGDTFNETSLCLSAALSDAGIVVADTLLALEHLEAGMLVPPFEVGLRSTDAYWLFKRRKPGMTPSEASFEKWLRAELAAHDLRVARLLAKHAISLAEE